MGGKPNPGTPPDKRLSRNKPAKPKAPKAGRTYPRSPGGSRRS